MAKAFMSWVGGKQRLLPKLVPYLPARLGRGEIKRYAEPFLGAGSMFFHVASSGYGVQEFFLLDLNERLIWLYVAIRDDVGGVIERLREIESEFVPLPVELQSEYYYEMRTLFNEFTVSDMASSPVTFAAVFLFLKRTVYGGLYRTNSSGEFNASFCNKHVDRIVFPDVLLRASETLRSTDLVVGDFSECIAFVDGSTLVYMDPPYVPVSETSNFSSYTDQGFSMSDHDRLRHVCNVVDQRGGMVMLSNSDFDGVDEYYNPMRVNRVRTKRTVAAYQIKNSRVNEVVVTNYDEFLGNT